MTMGYYHGHMTYCNFHHNCTYNIFQRNEHFGYVHLDGRLRDDNHLRHGHGHKTFNSHHAQQCRRHRTLQPPGPNSVTTTIRHRHGQYLQQRPPRPQRQQSQRHATVSTSGTFLRPIALASFWTTVGRWDGLSSHACLPTPPARVFIRWTLPILCLSV